MRPSSYFLISLLLFIGLLAKIHVGLGQYVSFTPDAWAEGGPIPVNTIDRGRSGSRSGVMTRAYARTVLIDRNRYPLAPEILIEDRKGAPLTVEALQHFRWNSGSEIEVKYWGPANQITQIVTLPEYGLAL